MNKKARLSALARLEASKDNGISAIDALESDEEEYASPDVPDAEVDDFVVGEGLGYEETGEDLYALDDQEARNHYEKQKKRKLRDKKRAARKRKAKKTKSAFVSKKSKVNTTASVKVVHTEKQTEEFMNSLLEDSDDEEEVPANMPVHIQSPKKIETVQEEQVDDVIAALAETSMEVEEPIEIEEEVIKPKPFSKPVVSPPRTAPKPVSEPPRKKQKLEAPAANKSSNVYTGEEGCEYFYFLDAYEDNWNNPGTVFLFGRRAILGTNRTESCCIVVKDMRRRLYILPKETIDGEGRMDFTEVKEEVQEAADKSNINIRIWPKPVEKKYCFQSRPEVPDKAEYVHIRYGFNEHLFNRTEETRITFSQVFGLRSSAKEILVLECDLSGPSWLKVKAKPIEGAKCSWCKSEFIIRNGDGASRMIKQIDAKDEYAAAPPLRVMTLAIQTRKTSKRVDELVCLSTVTHDHFLLDSDTDQDSRSFQNYICPLKGQPWPEGFVDEVKARGETRIFSSEKVMLNAFMAKLQKEDPDVIVGHSLINFHLEVMMSRMKTLGVTMWSKMGRLKKTGRNSMPKMRFVERGATAGRLMCDTFLSAQEFLFGESNYNFSALIKSQFSKEHKNIDVNLIPQLWSKTSTLLETMTHCLQDAMLVLDLVFKLEVLPLTKQLTCLCGNIWQDSLRSQRALRNEYLLLHEFYKNDYIVPERYTKKEKIDMGIISVDAKKGRRKKAEYSGGLVLDPKVGFYNTYILLLDFNSLYPSIIQEYNLCFSTVPHWEGMPDDRRLQKVFDNYPYNEEEQPDALLPTVITRLLNTRKQAKKEMKAAKNKFGEGSNEVKMKNIKQLSYKLVANSMYGCLGFSNSRFYCKPIAAMITALGRKNLQKAADIATQEYPSADVVYGDTDSIMVNTGLKSDSKHTLISKAKQMAIKIKNSCNKTYRKMFLELDDTFARFHILKKKKYAALKVKGSSVEGYRTSLEYKGLDLVRRDWAKLSSCMGKYVLEIIMKEPDPEEAAFKIRTYLSQRYEAMKAGNIPLEDYRITKKLTKDPKDYKAAAKLAHVECALKMRAAGMPVNVGDFIEYIVCEGTGPEHDRSYHISHVKEKQMKIDLDYYLRKQIVPPIVRLIDPLDAITGPMVGECFGGIRVSSRAARTSSNTNGAPLGTLDEDSEDEEIQFEDEEEKYAQCEKLRLKCRYCDQTLIYEGVLHPKNHKVGFKCHATKGCRGYITEENHDRDLAYYKNQLRIQFNNSVRKYSKRTFRCQGVINPSKCVWSWNNSQNRRKSVPLKASRECPCGGTVRETFSALKLNRQLDYFIYLFDIRKADENFKQKQQDAKVENPKTLRQKYDEVGVKLVDVTSMYNFARSFKHGSSYSRVDTKGVFETFIPLGERVVA